MAILIPILFIGAIGDGLPYGYIQFLRIACFLGFGWLAKTELEKERSFTGIVSIGFAILFNPIIKIRLDKNDWPFMNGFTCTFLVIWLIVVGIVALVRRKKRTKRATTD